MGSGSLLVRIRLETLPDRFPKLALSLLRVLALSNKVNTRRGVTASPAQDTTPGLLNALFSLPGPKISLSWTVIHLCNIAQKPTWCTPQGLRLSSSKP